MCKKITLSEVAEEQGYENSTQLLTEKGLDSVVPACCSEGCEVEPDGYCEHGYPSILIEAGMI